MSNQDNTNILETAAELIDLYKGTKSVERLISAVERNDLEEVYHINRAILLATAHHVALSEEVY